MYTHASQAIIWALLTQNLTECKEEKRENIHRQVSNTVLQLSISRHQSNVDSVLTGGHGCFYYVFWRWKQDSKVSSEVRAQSRSGNHTTGVKMGSYPTMSKGYVCEGKGHSFACNASWSERRHPLRWMQDLEGLSADYFLKSQSVQDP